MRWVGGGSAGCHGMLHTRAHTHTHSPYHHHHHTHAPWGMDAELTESGQEGPSVANEVSGEKLRTDTKYGCCKKRGKMGAKWGQGRARRKQ